MSFCRLCHAEPSAVTGRKYMQKLLLISNNITYCQINSVLLHTDEARASGAYTYAPALRATLHLRSDDEMSYYIVL